MSTTPNAEPQSPETPPRGPHAVAVVAAVLTWPLLVSGGQVTTYRVGMAVPDWPTTFGINMFLYDFWNAPWGVFIEHRHRLFGTALGLVAIVLAAWFVAADRRRWMKALGVAALLAVIAQGLFGRNRVLLNSTTWAAVHACTGQAVFAFLVALAVLTGRDWMGRGTLPAPDVQHLRRRSVVTLALVFAQVVVGAWLRHYGTPAALAVHAVLAVSVWGHAAMLAWRVELQKARSPGLVPSARAMALAVTAQVALGGAAWWMLRPFDGLPRPVGVAQALVRTGHQSNGALLLASVVVLTLRSFRHLTAAPEGDRVASSPATWEAVA
jgi:cytochrome c oxidase assembly protein subunit 15